MFGNKLGFSRRAVAVVAAVTTISVVQSPVSADPNSGSAAIERAAEFGDLAQLSRDAGRLGEELHAAQSDADAARAALDAAHQEAEEARSRHTLMQQEFEALRPVLQNIAVARYRGARMNPLEALLTSGSPERLVGQLSDLDRISAQTSESLAVSGRILDGANDAARESAEKEAIAQQIAADTEQKVLDLQQRHAAMQEVMSQVRSRVENMSAQQRARWSGTVGDVSTVDYGFGPGGAALRAAMTKLGAPYEWAATGPHTFDCSGLMVWAYRQIGITLPRSSQAQAAGGTAVSLADAQPGDLVTFYAGATHVGMYAGNGQVIHASDYGIPVKLAPVSSMPVHSVRRY